MFGVLTSIILDVLVFILAIGLMAYLMSAGAIAVIKKVVRSIIKFIRNIIAGIINICKGDEK